MVTYAFYILLISILGFIAFKISNLVKVLLNDNHFNQLRHNEIERINKHLINLESLILGISLDNSENRRNIEKLLTAVKAGIESTEQANKDSYDMLGDIDHRIEKLHVTLDGIEADFYQLRRKIAPTEKEIEFQLMKEDAQG